MSAKGRMDNRLRPYHPAGIPAGCCARTWRTVGSGCELRGATSCFSYKLQATSYELQATGYKLRATSYELQATGYKLRATSYELQATSYE
ncbi:MAG: hypothetical protein ACI37U_00480 [Bacteroides sp.]